MFYEYNDPFMGINNVMVRLLRNRGYSARLFCVGDPGWENHELSEKLTSYIKLDHPRISHIGLQLVNPKIKTVEKNGNYTIDIHFVVPKKHMSNSKEYKATLKYITHSLFSKDGDGIAWLGRELSHKLSEDEPTTIKLCWQLKPYENIIITPVPGHNSVHIVLRTRLTFDVSKPDLACAWELPSHNMFKCIELIAGHVKDHAS